MTQVGRGGRGAWAGALVLALLCGCGGGARPDNGPGGEGPPDDGQTVPEGGQPDGGDGGEPEPPPEVCTPGLGPDGWPVLQESIPAWHLRVAEADQQRLDANVLAKDYWVPAEFQVGKRTWKVQVRYRGNHTRKFPKKSWQVKFSKEDRFTCGREKLNLVSGYRDAALLTEKLWYDLAAAAGLRVPRARYVTLFHNGRVYGVMTELEDLEKPFVKAHGFDDDADVYRCGMFDCELKEDGARGSYQEPWTKRTNEAAPWDALHAFLRTVERTPQHALHATLERELDTGAYLTWLAVDAAIANDMVMDSRSFLVRDPATGKWTYVPWDLNNARSVYDRLKALNQGNGATRPVPGYTLWDARVQTLYEERAHLAPDMRPAWSTLSSRMLAEPAFRARYVAALQALLDGRFREAETDARLDRTWKLLEPALRSDPHVDWAYADGALARLKGYVRQRREFLRKQLPALQVLGTTSAVKVDRVGVDASGAPFVQLVNAGAAPVQLEGLYLTGDLRVPRQAAALPARELQPGEVLTLGEGGELPLGASVRADHPHVGLFAADGWTPLDVLWAPPLGAGEAYGRAPRGSETFAPTEGR